MSALQKPPFPWPDKKSSVEKLFDSAVKDVQFADYNLWKISFCGPEGIDPDKVKPIILRLRSAADSLAVLETLKRKGTK